MLDCTHVFSLQNCCDRVDYSSSSLILIKHSHAVACTSDITVGTEEILKVCCMVKIDHTPFDPTTQDSIQCAWGCIDETAIEAY